MRADYSETDKNIYLHCKLSFRSYACMHGATEQRERRHLDFSKSVTSLGVLCPNLKQGSVRGLPNSPCLGLPSRAMRCWKWSDCEMRSLQ